jgi:hypothetical protein
VAIFLSNDIVFGAIIGSIIYLEALIVFVINGRPLISPSGQIKLWEGDIQSPENSQHIFDWYTFTHILHGFIFYAIGSGTAYIFPSADIGVRGFYIMALLLEALWETIENSPPAISRHRETAANGYHGDSVLNSVSDMLAISFGYWLAYLLPPLAVLGLALVEEIFNAIAIRDNLTLSVVQLVHPSESISRWQAQGGITQRPFTQDTD